MNEMNNVMTNEATNEVVCDAVEAAVKTPIFGKQTLVGAGIGAGAVVAGFWIWKGIKKLVNRKKGPDVVEGVDESAEYIPNEAEEEATEE